MLPSDTLPKVSLFTPACYGGLSLLSSFGHKGELEPKKSPPSSFCPPKLVSSLGSENSKAAGVSGKQE